MLVAGIPMEIGIWEVKEVCKNLKNWKPPGLGGIPAEFIKNGTPKLYKYLAKNQRNGKYPGSQQSTKKEVERTAETIKVSL